jgi:hypothetical protein
MGKDKKSKIVDVEIVSINPLQDDLDESIGSLGLGASVPVKLMQSIREGIGSGAKKLGRSLKKGERALNKKSDKFLKYAQKNPNKGFAMIATPGIGMGTTIANHREKNGAFDKDLSSTEGSFKKGGLVRSGKPKIAKKGWR